MLCNFISPQSHAPFSFSTKQEKVENTYKCEEEEDYIHDGEGKACFEHGAVLADVLCVLAIAAHARQTEDP